MDDFVLGVPNRVMSLESHCEVRIKLFLTMQASNLTLRSSPLGLVLYLSHVQIEAMGSTVSSQPTVDLSQEPQFNFTT